MAVKLQAFGSHILHNLLRVFVDCVKMLHKDTDVCIGFYNLLLFFSWRKWAAMLIPAVIQR